jgi:lysine 2,3-aminomutase
MKVTPYYLSLVDWKNPEDPILRQCIPSSKELEVQDYEIEDPIGDTNEELSQKSMNGLTHRYKERVVIYPTPFCATYCRHCFRRRIVGKEEFILSKEDIQNIFDYIKGNDNIKEVIFSGGDPLSLTDFSLNEWIKKINDIPHVKIIRIHTRFIVTNPFRVTKDFIKTLKNSKKPIWIVTHFNHPNEFTDHSRKAISMLIDNGFPVLNQSVLLKGINNDEKTLRELLWNLIENRVKPYYFHYLDLAKGTSNFRTTIKEGIELFRKIRGTIPGYAIPHFMIDIPEGHGKIPLNYNYIRDETDTEIILEPIARKKIRYPKF